MHTVSINIYNEAVFEEAFQNDHMGIKINEKFINNLRYADDTVILSGTMHHLQRIMDKLSLTCIKYGLKMNANKTKFMIITKDKTDTQHDNKKLTLNNTAVERVYSYKYLGTWINSNGDASKEIRCRVEIARTGFFKMRKIFSNRDLSLELRIRMFKCYVLSILLYGVEAWTLMEADLKKIEAFEMWCYRRILNISWVDRVTNVEVLRRIGKDKEVVKTVKTRKLRYFGHMMRGQKYRILQLILEGKICGKRSRGRPRTNWMQNLRQWFGCSDDQMFKAAREKIQINMMISNLR